MTDELERPHFASYRTLFETDAIGVAVTDGRRHLLDVNRKLAATLGYADPADLIGAAGGVVSVASTPASGTVFTVRLPIDEQADEDLDEEGADEVVPPGDRILLVDDDAHVRSTTARMLLSAGCGSVLEACDGREALELVESGADFDVLVTDLIMPRMDGVELAMRLREQRPELRVLYVSGYTADLLGDKAAGPNSAYLPKPFSVAALRLSLSSL